MILKITANLNHVLRDFFQLHLICLAAFERIQLYFSGDDKSKIYKEEKNNEEQFPRKTSIHIAPLLHRHEFLMRQLIKCML